MRERLERFRESLGRRDVFLGKTQGWEGANPVWVSYRQRAKSGRTVYHADKHCQHFPEKTVQAYPAPFAKDAVYLQPCDHCTVVA